MFLFGLRDVRYASQLATRPITAPANSDLELETLLPSSGLHRLWNCKLCLISAVSSANGPIDLAKHYVCGRQQCQATGIS